MINSNDISFAQNELKNKKIGILGDFCVDIYWDADMTRSELSRETPHFPLPVVNERFYPGAGGNVANNIAALQPGKLCAMFLYGDDWRAHILMDVLKKAGINTDYAVECPGRFTNAYCKPMRKGISDTVYEDPRLDFDNYEASDAKTEERVIEALRKMANEVDILCVADQFRYGIVTEKVREEIVRLSKNGLTVTVDSRYNIAKYSHCLLKPNEVECWRAVYGNEGYLNAGIEEFKNAAEALARKNEARVLCTLGARGAYYTDGVNGVDIPARKLDPPLDICGAGDTSLSALTCCLAAGLPPEKAAGVAALASAVTVKKIGVTGTASFDEIKNRL